MQATLTWKEYSKAKVPLFNTEDFGDTFADFSPDRLQLPKCVPVSPRSARTMLSGLVMMAF